ncbi:hypothetical protein JTB14_001846 [Gonioctena quinquepunctata]|nr:hypothetical protein JTB14_001846 [Gonioctena quinquepunctata]
MIALRLLTVVALACIVHAGEDLDLGVKLLACLKEAIIVGVPSAGIPPHSPAFYFKKNVSYHGDIGVASGTFNLTNISWAGIPDWTVTAEQLNKDTDPQAIIKYSIYWPKFLMSADYYFLETSILNKLELQGKANLTWEHTSWSGTLNFTKSGHNLTQQVEDLQLQWNVLNLNFGSTGLGELESYVATALETLIKTTLNSGVLGNKIGEALKTRLNSAWFAHNEKIDKVLEFCANSTASYWN